MSGFSLASIKNQLDEVRAQVYPRNETERKVYEALSSKNWGASSTLLNEIASDSNDYEKYGIMSTIIWASLETDGKSWKQIFKALTLIDFLVKNGSERFIEAARDKLYKIRTLQDFNYYEGTVDKGSGVREKAKQLVEMLGNNDIIRSERDKSRQLRNKFVGIDSRNVSGGGGGGSYDSYSGSGGGNNYGGRYGNDRNDSRSDSGNRYGGHGSDSYTSNNDDRRGSTSGASRYGGGAYNSDRPPRYGDDAPAERSLQDNGSDQWGEDPPADTYNKNKPFASKTPAASAPSTAGKLKVNIKKADAPVKPVAAAPEKDLFEFSDPADDFLSGGAAPTQQSSSASSLFDPFSDPVPAAPQRQVQQAAAAFDPFGPAPTQSFAAPAAAAFDPFAPVPYPPQQGFQQAAAPPVPAFDPFNTPAPAAPFSNAGAFPVQSQQQSFQSAPMPFANNQQQQQQNNTFQGFQTAPPAASYSAPPQQSPRQQQQQQQQQQDADFGDFTAAPNAQQTAAAAAKPNGASKWGDLGKLVDLSGIGKNEVQAKPSAGGSNNNAYQQSAFAGLDGFSKTPQNMAGPGGMMGAPRPLGSYTPAGAPMGQAMRPMSGAPMGMPQQPMGGMMGGAPQMGMVGMGGMGYGQQMQPGMGGMGGPPGGMMMGGGMPQQQGMMMGGPGGYGMQQQPQQGSMMMGGGGMQMGGGQPGMNNMGMGMGMGNMNQGQRNNGFGF